MGIGSKGENLIFILSQPRTGSTMLQRILGNHPDIHTTSEPWLMIPPLIGLICRWTSPEGTEARCARSNVGAFLKTFPGGEDEYFNGLRNMYTRLYNSALKSSGKKYFLDKTPRYAYFIPELKRIFPEARFIILFRTPLAVLCSIAERWARFDEQELFKNWGDDLRVVPRLLVEGIKVLGRKCFVVHYERLVSQPKTEIQKICKKLGLKFIPEIIEYENGGLPQWRHFADQHVYEYTKPVSQLAESWKSTLKHPLVWKWANEYLQLLGGETLERMGYSYQELNSLLKSCHPH